MKYAAAMVIAAMAVAGASSARAEMPNYDVEGHCKQVGDAVGGSEEIRQACLQEEQAAYDKLKPKWDGLPTAMKNHCDQVGRAVGESFEILQACVEQEIQATKANQQFQFKR
jgi:hypothetical protein